MLVLDDEELETMEFLDSLPAWFIVLGISYLAILCTIAVIRGQEVQFWPPKISARTSFEAQSAKAKEKAKENKSAHTKSTIDGKYFVDSNPQYRVTISSSSDKLIHIENPEWEGVGLFDGDLYFGMYKVKDRAKEQLRGKWGVHRAKLRVGDGSLEYWGLELKGTSKVHEYTGAWIKEKRPNK
jgi:hypothetical protein